MPSREKVDLYRPLIDAWDYASMRWKMKYPGLPQPFISCTYRTGDEQNQLYARGRTVLKETINGKTTKVGKVTNAKAGESPHNIYPSMAFDIAFWKENKKGLDWDNDLFKKFWELMAEKYEEIVTWGGNFNSIPDRPHFELKTWKDFKKR